MDGVTDGGGPRTLAWLMSAHQDLAVIARTSNSENESANIAILKLLGALSKNFSWQSSWLLGPFSMVSSAGQEVASHWSVGTANDALEGKQTLVLTDALSERIRVARSSEQPSQGQQGLRTGADVPREVSVRVVGGDGCHWLLGMQAASPEQELNEWARKSFSSLASRLCELVETRLLRSSLARVQTIEEAVWRRSKSGLVLVSSNGACIRANRAASQLVGRPEGEMVHLAAREWLPSPMSFGPNGSSTTGSWQGRLVGNAGTENFVDIAQSQITHEDETLTLFQLTNRSDVVALEEQLEQLQRHRLMGRLSGGVVHDLNNLLTVIVAALEGAERNPESKYLPEMLSDAHEAVRRCESLCRQLLTMGRHRPGAVRVIAPDPTIAGMRKLLERTVPDDAEFSLSLKASGASIELPLGALEQILLNLLVNAREAMPSKGVISASTRIEGDRFHLYVTDEGPGIPEGVLQRMFEPYYSTKQQPGTGVGLAVVHALVAQVGGQIEAKSAPGKGTSFDVSFALASEESDASSKNTYPTGFDESIRGEGRIVLLCENEAVLRDVIQRTLSQQGYEVVSSSDGRRGLELIEGGFAIDALVTDLVMPKVGGAEIAQACNRGGRRTPVVFVSGLLEQEALPALGAPSLYLAKPFRMHDLLGALQAVLSEDQRS